MEVCGRRWVAKKNTRPATPGLWPVALPKARPGARRGSISGASRRVLSQGSCLQSSSRRLRLHGRLGARAPAPRGRSGSSSPAALRSSSRPRGWLREGRRLDPGSRHVLPNCLPPLPRPAASARRRARGPYGALPGDEGASLWRIHGDAWAWRMAQGGTNTGPSSPQRPTCRLVAAADKARGGTQSARSRSWCQDEPECPIDVPMHSTTTAAG